MIPTPVISKTLFGSMVIGFEDTTSANFLSL
jgi:hypothetical protein